MSLLVIGRHGIFHGYADIIHVKYFVFWGKFLLRTFDVLLKIEFFTFLRSFGNTLICPEAYYGYIYNRNKNYIKSYVNQALSYLTMSDFVQVYSKFIDVFYQENIVYAALSEFEVFHDLHVLWVKKIFGNHTRVNCVVSGALIVLHQNMPLQLCAVEQ